MDYLPLVVSWNLTGGCNLRCPHCYIGGGQRWPNELSTNEGLQLVDRLAEAGTELLILTGGEPLLREDLPILASHAAGKGMAVVLGTNGTLISREQARALKESGVAAAGISIDSIDPARHDAFRGVAGAWQRAVDGVDACLTAGLDVLIHTTAMKMNSDEIPDLVRFAHDRGARAFHLFFLVCTGRGERLTDLTPEEYERLLCCVLDAQDRYPGMLVRARCAPYIRRLAMARGSVLLESAGCLAGTSYCRITPTGDVTPCPYLPVRVGNVRVDGFQRAWGSSEVLARLRSPRLLGKCGQCSLSQGEEPICVGCRARALALTGNILAEDPWCLYEPHSEPSAACAGAVQQPARQQEPGMERPVAWTGQAMERLGRVPLFIRGRVKQAAEAHARAQGLTEITPEVLAYLRSQAGPPDPQAWRSRRSGL